MNYEFLYIQPIVAQDVLVLILFYSHFSQLKIKYTLSFVGMDM